MALAKVSKEFPVAPGRVWTVLTDPHRFEEWLTVHTKWKELPPAQLSAGATMTEVLSIMGMANTITFTVVDYDAPTTTKFSGTGMAGAQISFTLTVTPQGDNNSLVTIDAEFISQMMVGAIGGAIERASTRELDASLTNLAGLLA
ncbi:hypothetical protein NBRGN_010_00770 [Nocardia brasiliensis NBRC 14402]|uniref:type II toxin-antitoxin system Rv0910 family toxin n=1 Tax=Nocardia brasiliensis TaxID=37326 RepID=UPI0003026BAD|nr:SRPBCC family protein [Nocardia brasiliensis]ASF10273.1 SRPBCC family protein [Nocardia brasiliensis]GAJ79437.1 hypothetical protein NBRGN_010_00770 [Nocardia brasiliensis NBRC 14402]SUB11263.1 Toxin Rv0910/MT0934 [Nocardia brasiliensis]